MIPILKVRDEDGKVKPIVAVAVPGMQSHHADTHKTGGEDALTPADIGAAPEEHTHSAEDIGAASADHEHTADSVGAAPKEHTHSVEDIGAVNKSGDTMNGNLDIRCADGLDSALVLINNDDETQQAALHLDKFDLTLELVHGNTRRRLQIADPNEVDDSEYCQSLRFYTDNEDGSISGGIILTTDNLLKLFTLEDIGAATTATYSATVTTTWTASGDYFYQDIAVPGILETDTPIVDIKPGSDNAANVQYSEGICNIFRITTAANKITVWATEKPSVAIPIQLKVVR